MARPLRIEYPGAWYHVMNRGANRSRIFYKNKDYELFLEVLQEACNLFNVSISAYCLMNTHYHIVVHTPEGNLSRFMRHVNGVYTQRYNRKYEKDGPLFRGRYKAILIQADEYLTQAVKYVHQNPIKAKVVNNLNDFKWSSHRLYLKGKNVDEWMDINSILAYFSLQKNQAIKNYNEFMDIDIREEVWKFYSKKVQSTILGDEEFVEMVKRKFIKKDKKSDLEVKEKRMILGEGRVKMINKEICERFNIKESILYQNKRGEENIPRQLAISLSRELSGLSFPEIAKRYEIASYKTVASSNVRLREKMNRNEKLKRQYMKLKNVCSQEEI